MEALPCVHRQGLRGWSEKKTVESGTQVRTELAEGEIWHSLRDWLELLGTAWEMKTLPTFTLGHLYQWRHAVAYYATSRKVAVSRPDEVNGFLKIYLILPAALGPGVHSASNRNEYRKQKNNVSWRRAWPVRGADNLIAIWEPTV
jgi:hypothetical protein